MQRIVQELNLLISRSNTNKPTNKQSNKRAIVDAARAARMEKTRRDVYSALRKIGRPATRPAIERAMGRSLDYRAINRVQGLVRRPGTSNGKAAFFYWFAE